MKTEAAQTVCAPASPWGSGVRLVPTGLGVGAVTILLSGAPVDLIAGALPAPPEPTPYVMVAATSASVHFAGSTRTAPLANRVPSVVRQSSTTTSVSPLVRTGLIAVPLRTSMTAGSRRHGNGPDSHAL